MGLLNPHMFFLDSFMLVMVRRFLMNTYLHVSYLEPTISPVYQSHDLVLLSTLNFRSYKTVTFPHGTLQTLNIISEEHNRNKKFTQLLIQFCYQLLRINKPSLIKMEYKVRMESQSLVERIFHTYERRGYIRAYQVPSMLKAINPDLEYGQEELQREITENERTPGILNFDSFNQIAVNLLLRNARKESDFFSHKNDISLHDFSLP